MSPVQHIEHFHIKEARKYFAFNPHFLHLVHPRHNLQLLWSSRDQRKGRYPHVLLDGKHLPHIPAFRFLPVGPHYPFRDISYWVALVFTLGCVAWVMNGWFSLFPTDDGKLNDCAVGWSGAIGGTLFEIGSVLLYWEALNPEAEIHLGLERDSSPDASPKAGSAPEPGGAHGTATQDMQQQHQDQDQGMDQQQRARRLTWVYASHVHLRPRDAAAYTSRLDPSSAAAQSEHTRRLHQPLLPLPPNSPSPTKPTFDIESQQHKPPAAPPHTTPDTATPPPTSHPGMPVHMPHSTAAMPPWRWVGFRWRDVGFIASFLQLVGATIFWMPTIFGIPGLASPETSENEVLWNVIFWGPQVLGACFFIASSLLFMMEVQPNWWRVQPFKVGWHVGFWNLLGSVGFWLSGFFGFWDLHGRFQKWGVAGSTFWGSWAFLLGSYLQLLEAVNKVL